MQASDWPSGHWRCPLLAWRALACGRDYFKLTLTFSFSCGGRIQLCFLKTHVGADAAPTEDPTVRICLFFHFLNELFKRTWRQNLFPCFKRLCSRLDLNPNAFHHLIIIPSKPPCGLRVQVEKQPECRRDLPICFLFLFFLFKNWVTKYTV